MASSASQHDPRLDVAEALRNVEITELDIWDKLDILSTHTQIEAVEVPVEGIILSPENRFSAVINIYLTLQYGNNDEEGFTTSDSFVATVKGHLIDDSPTIDTSSVDTSSFYE